MPKMKTHRGAAKRVKRTASGGFKRHKAVMVSDADAKVLKHMLIGMK